MGEGSSNSVGLIATLLAILFIGGGSLLILTGRENAVNKKMMLLPTSAEAKFTNGDKTIICKSQKTCELKAGEKYDVEISSEGFKTKTLNNVEVSSSNEEPFMLYACLEIGEGSYEVYSDRDIDLLKTMYKKCENGEQLLEEYREIEEGMGEIGDSEEEFDQGSEVDEPEEGDFDYDSEYVAEDDEEIIYDTEL